VSALTRQQIAQFAYNAGFRNPDLSIAVAIALAESAGDPAAYDPEEDFFLEHGISGDQSLGRGSYGLWQIFRHEHPEFRLWNLGDPQVNATAAWFVYCRVGRNFTPWSTWKSEAYKKDLEPVAEPTA
jgi:lysozyme-like protein